MKLLQKKYREVRNFGFKIYLRKNIPIGAGLGGGSGNAATTILAINELYNLNLTEKVMAELGTELGSDVPFFIYQKPAFVTGRGEDITLLQTFPSYYCILVYPNIAISTKKMYEAFDLRLTKERPSDSNHEFLAHIQEIEKTRSLEFFHNDFDSLCVSLYPEIGTCKAMLLQSGAEFAMVSGSGSSIFLIY